MCVHDAEHDFKNTVFISHRLCQVQIQFFSGPQISYWSVVGWSVVVGRWLVVDGRLVGW